MLQENDPFLKSLSNACRLLNGWHKSYSGQSIRTEANNHEAFVTVSQDKDEQKKTGKKKEITCFRCKNVGHYTSECDEELPSKTPKNASSMLIMDEESSTEQGQDTNDKDGQYYERNAEVEGNEQDNDLDNNTEREEEDTEGQFNDEDSEGIVFTQDEILCNVQEKAGIPSSWILLESQSTVDVFCNLKMLHNFREAKQLHCNAGTTLVTMKGDLKGYGPYGTTLLA